MVKPAATVGCLPILRAVAPPCVKLLRRLDKMPRDINPICGFLDRGKMFAFNLCVADDIDELLMAPNIMLKRCNVKITRQYGRAGDRARPLGHARKKPKLLSEF